MPANAKDHKESDSAGKSVIMAPAADKPGVPSRVYESLEAIQKDLNALEEFNHYEWDESTKRLIVHHHGNSDNIVNVLAGALSPKDFALAEDKYSVRELQKEAQRITTAHPTIGGAPVTSAGPTSNADGIVIQVDSGDQRTLSETLNLSAVSAFPVTIEEGQPAEPASRQYDPVSPHWGGAVMSRPTNDPGYFNICTTGFAVGYMSGSTLVTKNLTADHCGPTSATWRTGISSSTPILGGFIDTNSGGSDLKLISTMAGVSTSFGPVIYNGNENSNTGLGIAGAVPPILNDYWCYSGSQSGIICNNKVTQVNQYICYGIGGLGPCYGQQAVSVQQDGISAAGNGDSGGPVVAERNSYAYAAGIISGIRNAGTNCQGKPASETRKCSATVITSPVQAFFNANPNYGILTYG